MDKIKSVADLKHDRRNPRKHNERNLKVIVDSLHDVGFARSIVIDEDNTILAGNGVTEAAVLAGIEKVVEIEADGNTIIAVRRTGLTNEQKQRLKYFDNRAGELAEWDAETLLADLNSGVDLDGIFSQKELANLLAGLVEDVEQTEGAEAEKAIERSDVPDAVWPTDNDLGIPLLDIKMQADAFDQPWGIWGNVARSSTLKGTWLFYTEDERFEALWSDPSPILNTKCVNAVEPNFSCYENMPPAVAIWQVYRKRWIARWWQQFGIRIFADLNVAANHYGVNRLGIPKGWRSFATRGYSERIAQTEKEYQQACEIADGATPLFLVYGGGQKAKESCLSNGWLWIPEVMDIRGNRKIVGA